MDPKIKRLLSLLLTLALVFSLTAPAVSAAGATAASGNTVEIEVGGSVKLKSSGVFSKTTWTTSDADIATVSSNGAVTGVAPGTATITATSKSFFSFFGGGTKTTTYTVIVKEAAVEEPTEPEVGGLTVKAGETLQLEVGTSGGTVTWKSSNNKIATVDGKGLVIGISEGNVTITATEKKTTGGYGFWFFWWGGGKTTTTVTEFKVTVLPGDEQPTEPEVPTEPEIPTEPPVVTYTVTFESNGGSTVEPQTIEEGLTATEPEAPTMEGYTFVGWYADVELTEAYDFATPITGDITLYAVWEEVINYYTVTFESNGGSEVEEQFVEPGAFAIRPEDPVKEGYRLIAWYGDEALTSVYDFDEPVNADITLYASWEELVEEEDSILDQDSPDVEIYVFDTDIRSIVVGEEVLVTFEAEIFAETALSDDEVVLYQDEEAFGVMHDDGMDGDVTAGDGIFIYQATLSSEEECIRDYKVKVREASSEVRNIGFYVPMTGEELDGIQIVDNALAELMVSEGFAALTIEEKATQVVELLTMLAEESLVIAESIYYEEVDRAVYYEYATGALGMVILEQETDLNVNGTGEKSTNGINPDNTAVLSVSAEAEVLNTSAPDNERNVLILNGFENTSYRRDYYNNLETEWDALGLNTTIDVNVTVTDMKNLDSSDWDVVVFAMHGSKYRTERGANKRPVLCINEVPTSTTDAAYAYELNTRHTVIKVNYVDGTSGYWIAPLFFTDNYSSRDLDGMMFFSETCMFYGCDCQTTDPDYTLANAITGRSAEVVVGYHNSVGADYSRNVMKIVIEESFNGATVNAALNTAKREEGNNDNKSRPSDDKYIAYPLVDGSGSFVLRPDGLVKGSVKDADTSVVISNALIRAYDENNDEVASTRSDSSGSYILSLSAGTYTLEISAGSYKKGKISVTVDSEGTTYVETFLLVSNTFNMGSANGTITNSITEGPVGDVTVKFRKNWNNKTGAVVASTTTNSNGYYEIDDLKVGLYTIEYYKSGYVTGYKNIFVLLGSTHNAVISPVTSSGVYRIVLTWGENPSDLDSHVYGALSGGESFHVYYSHKSQYDGDVEICNLDVDDVTSYGPETITLTPNTTAPYYYYIYRFSGSGSIATSGAQIKVYSGDTLVATFNAPTDQGTSDYWNVFAIVNGEIIVNNTISSSANTSYAN